MQIQPPLDRLQQRRKTPRVALALETSFLVPLTGVVAMWEDRSQSHLFDLSLTGIVLEKTGVLKTLLAKAKPGFQFSVLLKFEGDSTMGFNEERLSLDLRVLENGLGYVSAMFDAINSEGRVRLTQGLKDHLVVQNMRLHNSPEQMRRLHPEFASWSWYHSAFDTNLLILRETLPEAGGDVAVKGLVMEYDTLTLRFSTEGGLKIQKAQAMAELGHGYSQLWQNTQVQKVAMGASWSQRLENLFEAVIRSHPGLKADFLSAQHFLQALREN